MDDSKIVEVYFELVNVKVVVFVCFEVGEGIEKVFNDFEVEVVVIMVVVFEK